MTNISAKLLKSLSNSYIITVSRHTKSIGQSLKEEAMNQNTAIHPLQYAMPLLNTPYQPGHCREAVETISDPDTKNIALAEYSFFRGEAETASDLAEPYLTHQNLSFRLSACWIFAYANLTLNRIEKARKAIAAVKEVMATMDEDTSPYDKALATCVATGAQVLLHLPLPKILSPLRQYIHKMPPGLRLFVLYVEAHHCYLNKQYGACVGIAETALALEEDLYPIPSVYLHLVACMGYINMKHPDLAREHLLQAWEIARPDDMIEAFGEHHGLLCGMLEAVIKKDYPADFNRMIDITYNFSAGWRKIHNPETGNTVADGLTTTEFAVAMLAAKEWTNKEIATHLNVSVNTVKMHISSALQKLNISQRKELARFMLK